MQFHPGLDDVTRDMPSSVALHRPAARGPRWGGHLRPPRGAAPQNAPIVQSFRRLGIPTRLGVQRQGHRATRTAPTYAEEYHGSLRLDSLTTSPVCGAWMKVPPPTYSPTSPRL